MISCFALNVEAGLHLHPRRISRRRADPRERASKKRARRISSARTSSAPASICEIYVHRGAGAYICGEETGLIESLEGKRAYPRIKPPYFPAVLGLYMCPTIVNNVETLCHVKHIIAMGGAEYAKLGTAQQHRHPHRLRQRRRAAARVTSRSKSARSRWAS